MGVVIMVLALTILGLSLFSLSSYESQFLNRSLDETQTFQYAQGGLDRARLVLATTSRLESVRASLPPGVIWARASQDHGGTMDTTGNVLWDSDHPVTIEVLADYRGVTRRLEGQFQPRQVASNYDRLVTAARTFRVNPDFRGDDRSKSIQLAGTVWHSTLSDSAVWQPVVTSFTKPTTVTNPGPPIPDAPSFIASRWAATTTEPVVDGPSNQHVYHLVGDTNSVTYFRWNDRHDDGGTFSLLETGVVTLEVTGRVVWLFDRGFKFEGPVTVRRPSSYSGVSSLVIVAKPNGVEEYHPETGVWFWGGLQSPDTDVILVSDGGVQVEQINNFDQNFSVQRLAIFAGQVLMTGPKRGRNWLLRHPSTMATQIAWLSTNGALPNSAGASSMFKLIAGTWREPPTP